MPRAFVAADIHRKTEIKKIQEDLVSYLNLDNNYLKLVRPENFHFTLVFFGDVDNFILDKIVTRISKIEFRSFEINYGRIGAFPSDNRAKVIWIGLDEKTRYAFNQLFDAVMSKLSDLNLKLEKKIEKMTIPHLTLFRTRVTISLKGHEIRTESRISDKIDTVSVKKSIITQQGSSYENIVSVNGK